MRRLLAVLVLCGAGLAAAQVAPNKVITVQTDAELAITCATGCGDTLYAIQTTRGEVYQRSGGTWVRMDLPTCNPDPPTGSPANNPVCLSRANGQLEIWGQYGGAWVRVSGAIPAGSDGDVQVKSGTALGDSGIRVQSAAKPDSSPAMPCLDIWGPDNSRDGTCDLWLDPVKGYVRANGEPHFSGRVTIFGLVSDQHGGKDCGDCDGVLEAGDSAASWMAVEAKTYGISQTFALQAKDDCWGYALGSCPYHCETADWNGDGTSECGYGWGSQEVQTYRAAGMQVGTHVGSHCTIGPMSPTLSEGWRDNAAGGAYKDTNATFSVTEGSATVTGTNSEFSAECGDPTYNFNPPGSLLLVDVDGKGTAAGTVVERYIARVDSATVLTLDAALPSDLDADGTTGETFSALPAWYDDDDADSTVNYDDNTGTGHVGIITSPRQWRADVKDSCDRIRTQTGDSDWICKTGASVGPAEINDGWEVLVATYGLQTWANEAGAAGYHQRGGASPVGAPMALAGGRFIIDCANDWTTGMLPAFEAAVRSRGALVMLSGHTAFAVGACTAANDDYWRQDTYTSFLQWCRDRMRDGTAICTDVDTAMRLHRVYNEEASFGANLLVNPEVRRFSGLAQPSAGDADQPTDRWPWFSPDAATDFDGTAYMQDYDGTNEWTEWRDHSGTVTMQQGVRLQGGAYYAIHGWFKTTGYARGAAQGVRMCMEPVLARETGGAPEVIAFPTIWTTFPVVDANDGEVSTQAIANAINCSGYVNGEGTERSIFGFFYVPPELEGQWVRIGPKFIGSTVGAKVYFRDLSIVRYLPHPYNRAKFGSYTVPWATTSHFPHQGYSASAQNYAPWQWWWIPHVDGRADAPTSDAMKINTVTVAGVKDPLYALDGKGEGQFSGGLLIGDPDSDATAECIHRDASAERLYEDLDCDDTKDSGEGYLTGGGTVCNQFGYANAPANTTTTLNAGYAFGGQYYSWLPPVGSTLASIRCQTQGATIAGSGPVLTVYRYGGGDAGGSDLATTFVVGDVAATIRSDTACTSRCAISADTEYVQVRITADVSYTSTTVDWECTVCAVAP